MLTFTDEIQIMAYEDKGSCKWKWFEKLEDATTPMFSKRKAIAEDELNEFYYNQDWLAERGYIRSVVYYFKKGDSFENCGSDGYHVKAYVEHYFTSDTNVTLDYFKQWQKNVLGSSGNNGLLSDTFKLTPVTNLQCKKLFHNKLIACPSASIIHFSFFYVPK